MMDYFKKMVKQIFMTIFCRSKEQVSGAPFVKKMYFKLLQTILFVYNTFILVQLCCIGFAESHRVK